MERVNLLSKYGQMFPPNILDGSDSIWMPLPQNRKNNTLLLVIPDSVVNSWRLIWSWRISVVSCEVLCADDKSCYTSGWWCLCLE
jgi:hypothetical protein